MTLTSHVVSLDLALALREANYPQENALFYWSIPKPENASNEEERLVLANNCEVELCHKWTDWGDKFDRVAAPLASELLPKLPDYVEEDGKRSYLKLGKHNMYPGVEYSCGYVSLEEGRGFTKGFCVDNNMADPVAQTYLHLRKASLI